MWSPIIACLLSLPTPILDQDVVVHRHDGEAGHLEIRDDVLTLENGNSIEVESGVLLVPERRDRPDGPVVSIPFQRFRCTSQDPAPPLFLLAGGPGSSWMARLDDVDQYEDVRSHTASGDVVVFDQRGAGASLPSLECHHETVELDASESFDPERWGAELHRLSRECHDAWTRAGVDLDAYTTVENARDVHDLRRALGYERFSLLGGSYGSHLALEVMRQEPESVHRVVLYGVEGLDHTWDDPTARLATLQRIAADIERSVVFEGQIPEGGLLAGLRGVIEELEEEPVEVALRHGGASRTVVVDAELIRLVAGFQAGRRKRASFWPHHVLRLIDRDFSWVAQGALQVRRLQLDQPMHFMMDCSSGISVERRERYDASPARALIGDVNMEYRYACSAWRAPDLGQAFRDPLVSSIPTLIVHGTWDMSTPIENAREVAATLSSSQLVEVVGGGHGALYDLYRHWEPARESVSAFLRGEDVEFPEQFRLPPVQYAPYEGKR